MELKYLLLFFVLSQQGIESAPLFPILGSNEMPSRNVSRTSSQPNDILQDRVKSPLVESTSSEQAHDAREADNPGDQDEVEGEEEEEK